VLVLGFEFGELGDVLGLEDDLGGLARVCDALELGDAVGQRG
jgi:hypothetical protein